MPLPPLREQFNFTITLALRKALRSVRLRREVTDQQIDIMVRVIVDKILLMNWKIGEGPPFVGGGGSVIGPVSDEEVKKGRPISLHWDLFFHTVPANGVV